MCMCACVYMYVQNLIYNNEVCENVDNDTVRSVFECWQENYYSCILVRKKEGASMKKYSINSIRR